MLATTKSTRGIKVLFGAVAVTFAVLAGSLVVDLLGSPPAREVDRIPLIKVPDGVSIQQAGERAVVLVRDDDDITAFAAAVPEGDPLVWCPEHDRFATAIRASGYSLEGDKLGGPGPEALLRLDAAIVDEDVEVAAVYPIDWPRTAWSSGAVNTFADFTDDVCAYVSRY